MLNNNQRIAANYSGQAKYLLVDAGAGTGKTKTIVSRVEYLISQGISAGQILLLTFTNKSGKEMMERLDSSLSEKVKGMYAGTFHKYCIQVMNRLPSLFPMSQGTLLDTDDQKSLMNVVKGRVIGSDKVLMKATPSHNTLVDLYSFSRNSQIDFVEYLKDNHSLTPNLISASKDIVSEYQSYKEENGFYDYDDMIEGFITAVEKNPALNERLSNAYNTILVDEFQDTNPLQVRFLKLFIKNKTNLFCVGDPAQSIYAFRGACFEYMMEFSKHFVGAEVLPLSINYRSSSEILDLANWLLSSSSVPYTNKLISNTGRNGQLPKLVDLYSKEGEGRYICSKILEHVHKKEVTLDEVKIIVRTAWSARAIEASLIENKIPYKFIGGTALLKSAHIKDVLSLLYCSTDAHNEISWSRFLTLWPRIGPARASKAIDKFIKIGSVSLPNELTSLFGDDHGIVRAYNDVMQNINSPDEAILKAVENLDIILDGKYDNWKNRKTDFKYLVEVAKKYKNIREFLNAFSLESISLTEMKAKEKEEYVIVTTSHSSKGSESDICFVASANVGNYPHTRTYDSEVGMEEERRVLYVALTRARKILYVTRYGYMGSGDAFSALSPYHLSSIPNELVEKVSLY